MTEKTNRQTLREEGASALHLRVTGTGASYADGPPVVVTVPELSDRFSEALAPIAAYLTPDSGTTVRRITDFVAATGVCTLNRAASNAFDAALECYFILLPSDWTELINLALQRLFSEDVVVFDSTTNPALSAGVTLYNMPATTEWLQTAQQIERVVWRTTRTSGSDVYTEEQDVAQYSIIQNATDISILIPSMPEDITNLSLRIEARRHYPELATDATDTNCPPPLIKASVKVEALRRIWAIMGEEVAKGMFGSEMKNAEAELLDAKKQWVRQVVPVPVTLDRVFRGPETALPAAGFRW